MKHLPQYLAFVIVLTAGGAGVALAQAGAPPPAEIVRVDHPGRVLFADNCAACHGTGPGDDGSPMLPGTAALAAKYGGARPGALELRQDLPPPALLYFVRHGAKAMPGFRPAELSDTQVGMIADYLRATADANGTNPR